MSKPHPTDLRDAAYIRAATHFNAMVFLGVGRFDRVDGIVTLDEAKAVARSIEGRHPGKRAMIYAVTAERPLGHGDADDGSAGRNMLKLSSRRATPL